jgi:hypothetical protein
MRSESYQLQLGRLHVLGEQVDSIANSSAVMFLYSLLLYDVCDGFYSSVDGKVHIRTEALKIN